MLVASEKLAPPVGEWVRLLGAFVFLSACFAMHMLRHGRFDVWPLEVVVLWVGWAVGTALFLVYRRGGFGARWSLRRLARRNLAELTGVLRPIPSDPLAHAAPLAVQRPRKNQPGYRALSTRAFELELDDGRRVRVEPLVAVLDAASDTVPFGTRVVLSSSAPPLGSYRESATVVRGTEEQPLIIRVAA